MCYLFKVFKIKIGLWMWCGWPKMKPCRTLPRVRSLLVTLDCHPFPLFVLSSIFIYYIDKIRWSWKLLNQINTFSKDRLITEDCENSSLIFIIVALRWTVDQETFTYFFGGENFRTLQGRNENPLTHAVLAKPRSWPIVPRGLITN